MATMPSKEGISRSQRPAWRRSRAWSAPSGSATSRRCARTRRSRGGSSRRAASTSTGSASVTTWFASSWVPAATTLAWATEMSPLVRARAVAASGPRNRARAVRTLPLAVLGPIRSPARSQPAVEAAGWSWSAPAAPGRPGRPAPAASGLPGGPPAAAGPGPVRPEPHPTARTGPGQPAGRPTRPGPSTHRLGRSHSRPTPSSDGCRSGWSNVCSSPWGQPIKPPLEGKHHPEIVDTSRCPEPQLSAVDRRPCSLLRPELKWRPPSRWVRVPR